MKRLSLLAAVLAVAAGFAAPASAAGINLSGPHYNLNIIGVENPKSTPMTGSERHTIFVALGKQAEVTSRIYLTPGPFQVCDGNAFDPAHSCAGDVVAKQGAVFQLPCNSAVPTDAGCADGGADYEIWGRALGKPGGMVTMTTCATDATDATGALICSTDNALFSRSKGKSTFYNVTKPLTTVNACFTFGGAEVCEPVSLFDPMLQDFFWQYANKGLRLLQLRFYPL